MAEFLSLPRCLRKKNIESPNPGINPGIENKSRDNPESRDWKKSGILDTLESAKV